MPNLSEYLHNFFNYSTPNQPEWDAFLTIALFLPAVATFLWQFSPPGVQRVWERNFFPRGRWNKKLFTILFLIVGVPNFIGWYLFLSPWPPFRLLEYIFTLLISVSYSFSPHTLLFKFFLYTHPKLLSSTFFTPEQIHSLELWYSKYHWQWGLTLLLFVNLSLIISAFFIGRPHLVLEWIRWRIRVHWKKQKNFDEAFARYRSFLRVLGRESRGGEETSMVLRTIKGIIEDILSPQSFQNKNSIYNGNELEPLLEDVVTILLDSPHRPTPANFKHASRIFESIFFHFRHRARQFQTQNQEDNSGYRDLQAAGESIARLGQYIVTHLDGSDYDEELLRLLRLFQGCRCGEKHLSRALREVTIALLWSTSESPIRRLNHTVALQSLTTLENFTLNLPKNQSQLPEDQIKGQSEIFYDYLGVLAAFTKAGSSATNMALERWKKRREQILDSYQNLLNLSFENLEAAEAHLWETAIAHHRHTARFALADLLIETCKAWNISVTPDKAQRAQATA